jgi:sensor histidine kinase YesM
MLYVTQDQEEKINVTAKANEDKLIIKVKDNGVGMSEKTTNLLPHKWPL